MKRFVFCIMIFFTAVAFSAAAGIAEQAERGNEKADLSYAFGMLVALDLEDAGFQFNYDAFIRGFREVMENQRTRFTIDEAIDIVQAAFEAAHDAAARANLLEGEAFLAQNRLRPGVIVTPSGLQYEVIEEGTGATPGPSDIVLVHYQGSMIDGTIFDTTYGFGEPVQIPLDRVIPGWSEGLRLMREGGRARLYIPSHLAYGERGAGGIIGPNTVLIFDVELVSIMQPGEMFFQY